MIVHSSERQRTDAVIHLLNLSLLLTCPIQVAGTNSLMFCLTALALPEETEREGKALSMVP